MHLTARARLEGLDPFGLCIAFPRDQVQMALARAELARQVARERAGGRAAAGTDADGHHSQHATQCPVDFRTPHLVASCSVLESIADASCARQERRTLRPLSPSAVAADVSAFCLTTTIVSPSSASTT